MTGVACARALRTYLPRTSSGSACSVRLVRATYLSAHYLSRPSMGRARARAWKRGASARCVHFRMRAHAAANAARHCYYACRRRPRRLLTTSLNARLPPRAQACVAPPVRARLYSAAADESRLSAARAALHAPPLRAPLLLYLYWFWAGSRFGLGMPSLPRNKHISFCWVGHLSASSILVKKISLSAAILCGHKFQRTH